MAIQTQERIFPIKRIVWKYEPEQVETRSDIEDFFAQHGVKVTYAPAMWLNEHADDWLTFRVGDSTTALIAPGDYIVISGYGEAYPVMADRFDALGTLPA